MVTILVSHTKYFTAILVWINNIELDLLVIFLCTLVHPYSRDMVVTLHRLHEDYSCTFILIMPLMTFGS